jgi:hypothetical protein
MSKRPPDTGHAGKFKERLRANAEAAGLPDTPASRQRIEDAAWIDLAMDVTRAAILRGQPVEVSALERLVAARNSILPSATTLNVRFVDGFVCPKCQANTDAKAAAAAAEAAAKAALEAAAPPQPANVVPLHPAAPATPDRAP